MSIVDHYENERIAWEILFVALKGLSKVPFSKEGSDLLWRSRCRELQQLVTSWIKESYLDQQ